MNPFTDSLLRQLDDPALDEYVSYWDRVEALVIRIYKGKRASSGDAAEWNHVRAWLLEHHPAWSAPLQAYWPQTQIGSEPTLDDPFDALLACEEAAGFVGDWQAMQTLPAVREALNLWLSALIDQRARP